jgi:predicted DNA-binding protein YlxM (UPF0122 family)
MKLELDKYMTVKEYADKEKISVQAVYQKIRLKHLTSKKIGNLTLVKLG